MELCEQQIIVGQFTAATIPANVDTSVGCPSAAVEPTPPIVFDNCGRELSVSLTS